jgi:hypothetical protein
MAERDIFDVGRFSFFVSASKNVRSLRVVSTTQSGAEKTAFSFRAQLALCKIMTAKDDDTHLRQKESRERSTNTRPRSSASIQIPNSIGHIFNKRGERTGSHLPQISARGSRRFILRLPILLTLAQKPFRVSTVSKSVRSRPYIDRNKH